MNWPSSQFSSIGLPVILPRLTKMRPLRPFEQNAVVAAAGDDHLDAVGELALHGEVVGRVVAVVHGGIAVLERHRMLGVGAVDLDRAHALLVLIDGPSGDVDVVGPPVGELAAGVFVPPAELVVAALLDVVDLRRLAEPDVPVEFCRRVRLRERSADVAPPLMPTVIFWMSPSSPFCTMLTARRNRSRSLRCCVPTKKHLVAVLLAGVADQLVLFQRQRERLLAEDVLAGLQRLDGDLDVPVVGRDDADHVDVVALEHLAIVAVGVGLALADACRCLRPFGVRSESTSQTATMSPKAACPLGVAGAHAAHADAADPRPVVGRIVGDGGLRPGEVRHHAACGGGEGAGLEEVATRGGGGSRGGHNVPFGKRTGGERQASGRSEPPDVGSVCQDTPSTEQGARSRESGEPGEVSPPMGGSDCKLAIWGGAAVSRQQRPGSFSRDGLRHRGHPRTDVPGSPGDDRRRVLRRAAQATKATFRRRGTGGVRPRLRLSDIPPTPGGSGCRGFSCTAACENPIEGREARRMAAVDGMRWNRSLRIAPVAFRAAGTT